MATVLPAAVRKEIAAGRLRPVYVLRGEDEAGKTHLVEQFAASVDEDLRPFNLLRLHAAEATTVDARRRIVDELVSTARTLPMMSPRRVVVLHDAERVLFPKGQRDAGLEAGPAAQPEKRGRKTAPAPDENPLESYLQSPEPMTTLVLVCGGWDDRRRVAKLLETDAAVVTCGSPENDAVATRWALDQAAAAGVKMDAAAARALVGRSGLEIGRLRAALERVRLYAYGEPAITAEHVKEAIPLTNPDAQDFGIAKAIWDGDVRVALRQTQLELDAGTEPVMVLGQLRSAAENLRPPTRIPAAIDAVFRADLALKSTGGDPRLLLERLVVELCGTTSARGR